MVNMWWSVFVQVSVVQRRDLALRLCSCTARNTAPVQRPTVMRRAIAGSSQPLAHEAPPERSSRSRLARDSTY